MTKRTIAKGRFDPFVVDTEPKSCEVLKQFEAMSDWIVALKTTSHLLLNTWWAYILD